MFQGMGDFEEQLGKAATAVAKRDAHGAHSALLAAWKRRPLPDVASLLLELEHTFPARAFTAWPERAAETPPEERGALLPLVVTKSLVESRARLETLVEWGPDPRVSALVALIVREAPWSSDSSKPTWSAVIELIGALRDPALAAVVAEAPAGWSLRPTMAAWLTRALAKAEIPGAPAPATKPERAAIAAIRARLSAPRSAPAPRGERELFAAVYANPEHDAPRLVLADHLQQRGDPRGEFIALQIAGDFAKTKRLSSQHGASWLGALEPIVAKNAPMEFRRGFLSRATIGYRSRAEAEALGSVPEWATLEEVDFGRPGSRYPHIGPAQRHLLRAWKVEHEQLLGAETPWALETVGTALHTAAELRAFLGSSLLPRLRELHLWKDVERGWFQGVRFGALRHLHADGHPGELLEALHESPLESLTLGQALRFERGTDGRLSALTIVTTPKTSATWLEWRAGQLPSGSLERVVLDGEVPPAIRAAFEARIRRAGSPAPTRSARYEIPDGESPTLAWNERGLVLVEGRRVVVVDPGTRAMTHEFAIGDTAGISDDGLWVACDDGRTFAVESGLALGKVPHLLGGPPAISDDGAFVVMDAGGRSELWSVKAKKRLHAATHGDGPCAIERDGRRWVAPGRYVCGANPHHEPSKVFTEGQRRGVPLEGSNGVARQFRFFLGRVVGGVGDRLCVWDASTGKLLTAARARVEALAVSADGALVAIDDGEGEHVQCVLDARTLERRWSVSCCAYGANALAFSRDGRRLAVLLSDEVDGKTARRLEVLDVANGIVVA